MLQIFQDIDVYLFFLINVKLANAFLDKLMVAVTLKENMYLPGGLLWLWLMIGCGKKGRVLGVLIIFAILLSDQISSSVLKPLTGRLRPCKFLEGFRLLVHCGSKYGFPSSHATNVAAIGTVFIGFYKKWAPFWIVLIFLVGISRVVVGVHFPFDVLAGWLLGIGIGILLLKGLAQLQQKYLLLQFTEKL